jgi:hypothetical protein
MKFYKFISNTREFFKKASKRILILACTLITIEAIRQYYTDDFNGPMYQISLILFYFIPTFVTCWLVMFFIQILVALFTNFEETEESK